MRAGQTLRRATTQDPESHHHQEVRSQETTGSTEASPVRGPLPFYSPDVPDPAVPLPAASPSKN